MALFFVQPIALGSWLAMIPTVQSTLGLSKATLALALLGSPIALLPILQVAARAIDRVGVRRMFAIFFPIQIVALALPFFAWNAVSLFFALAAVGSVVAFLEVGLNLYAGRYEKRTGAMIMSRSHGYWAAGLGVGSAIATAVNGIDPRLIQIALALISGLAGMWVTRSLVRLEPDTSQQSTARRRLTSFPKVVWMIGAGMCFVTMAEGAMNDWGALYMTERFYSGETVMPNFGAGFAVTVFALCLAGGRLIGDALRNALGSVLLARVTIGSAVVGLSVIVLSATPIVALVGFALIGFGVSASFPLGVSAVAALDDENEASNIAFMSTVALCGFLLGPPMIGFIAEGYGLVIALSALGPGLCLSFLLASGLRVGRESE